MSDTPAIVPRLRVEGLTKSFFGVTVLHGVSFDAYAGEVLGVVGENGSGKSTTMNILAGILAPDRGTMALDGRPHLPFSRRVAEAAGVAFIQQELNIFPNLSVAENLLLGRAPRLWAPLPFVSGRKLHARAAQYLESVGLDVDPSAPASRLSSGERQLLEIARGLSIDARVMIFDEPTTSLAAREADRLYVLIDRIRQRGAAILFISHALDDVLRLSDRLLVMRDGQVTLREAREAMTPERLIVGMVGRSIEALFPDRKGQTGQPIEAARPALELSGVTEPGIVEDIHLRVASGEIVGISGLMGSGRSELARIVFGLDPHRRGEIRANGVELRSGDLPARLAAGMAFLTEDRRSEGLMMDGSVAENMALAALPKFARPIDGRLRDEALTKAMDELIQRLRVKSAGRGSTPVRSLSGGNQQKVVLGRWLLCRPELFILDEPTRGVDVGAKEEIYRLLAEMASRGMGILVISSEIEELIGLCDRILVMHRGRIEAGFARADFERETILKAAFGRGRSV